MSASGTPSSVADGARWSPGANVSQIASSARRWRALRVGCPFTVAIRGSSTAPRRCARAPGSLALERDLPEREPALELRLEWQLRTDLGLQLELALGVALVVAGRRHERVVHAALEVVDEVERPALLLEREHRGEEPVAVTAALERARHRVDRDDEVLEVGVAQDDPRVAVLVRGGLDLRARVGRGAREELLGVVDDLLEVRGGKRLERDPRDVPMPQTERRLKSDLSSRHGKQPIPRRQLELPLATHQRIKKSHAFDLTEAMQPTGSTRRSSGAGDGATFPGERLAYEGGARVPRRERESVAD